MMSLSDAVTLLLYQLHLMLLVSAFAVALT